jgi:hypothetical protein
MDNDPASDKERPLLTDKDDKAKPPKLHLALAPENQNRITFHMAEFSALKAEIAELVKVASTNLQYALAATGGITAWLLTTKVPNADEKLLFPVHLAQLRYSFLLPLLLSIAFGTLAGAAYSRINDKAVYLRLLEDWLRAAGLGWERTFKARPRTLGALYFTTWIGLLVVDLIVATLAFR